MGSHCPCATGLGGTVEGSSTSRTLEVLLAAGLLLGEEHRKRDQDGIARGSRRGRTEPAPFGGALHPGGVLLATQPCCQLRLGERAKDGAGAGRGQDAQLPRTASQDG